MPFSFRPECTWCLAHSRSWRIDCRCAPRTDYKFRAVHRNRHQRLFAFLSAFLGENVWFGARHP